MENSFEVFVGHIGISSVTLFGQDCKKYLTLPNADFARESVLINCKTEEKLCALLQLLIDDNVIFTSNNKSEAASDILFYRDKGKVSGKIRIKGEASFWANSGITNIDIIQA